MLAWNITWLTPWATAPTKPTASSGPPGSTRAAPRASPRKNSAQVVTMNGVGVGRERHIPPHQPGHDRRNNTADDQETDAHHTGTEEEERRDSDQRGVEAIDPGSQLRLVELERPGRRRADRRTDDRADRHQRRAQQDPQDEARARPGVLLKEDLPDAPQAGAKWLGNGTVRQRIHRDSIPEQGSDARYAHQRSLKARIRTFSRLVPLPWTSAMSKVN